MMNNKKSEPEECPVCFGNYDGLLQPRILPCGHTVCSQCIDNAIKNGHLTCPSCNIHISTADTQFPINYGVAALVRKLKGIPFTSVETVPAIPCQASARDISKKLLSQIQSSMSSLIIECEERLSQLVGGKPQHLELQDKFYDLIEQNKIAIKILEQEDANVIGMTTLEEERKTLLQTMLGSLNIVNLTN